MVEDSYAGYNGVGGCPATRIRSRYELFDFRWRLGMDTLALYDRGKVLHGRNFGRLNSGRNGTASF